MTAHRRARGAPSWSYSVVTPAHASRASALQCPLSASCRSAPLNSSQTQELAGRVSGAPRRHARGRAALAIRFARRAAHWILLLDADADRVRGLHPGGVLAVALALQRRVAEGVRRLAVGEASRTVEVRAGAPRAEPTLMLLVVVVVEARQVVMRAR
eukprot:7387258-Prymnesium_polylepis.1